MNFGSKIFSFSRKFLFGQKPPINVPNPFSVLSSHVVKEEIKKNPSVIGSVAVVSASFSALPIKTAMKLKK